MKFLFPKEFITIFGPANTPWEEHPTYYHNGCQTPGGCGQMVDAVTWSNDSATPHCLVETFLIALRVDEKMASQFSQLMVYV
jgi:hypothetical protein